MHSSRSLSKRLLTAYQLLFVRNVWHVDYSWGCGDDKGCGIRVEELLYGYNHLRQRACVRAMREHAAHSKLTITDRSFRNLAKKTFVVLSLSRTPAAGLVQSGISASVGRARSHVYLDQRILNINNMELLKMRSHTGEYPKADDAFTALAHGSIAATATGTKTKPAKRQDGDGDADCND
jgi:hypothetical protein